MARLGWWGWGVGGCNILTGRRMIRACAASAWRTSAQRMGLQPLAPRVAARIDLAHQREVLPGPRRALEVHAAAFAFAFTAARGARRTPPRLRRGRWAVGRTWQQPDRARATLVERQQVARPIEGLQVKQLGAATATLRRGDEPPCGGVGGVSAAAARARHHGWLRAERHLRAFAIVHEPQRAVAERAAAVWQATVLREVGGGAMAAMATGREGKRERVDGRRGRGGVMYSGEQVGGVGVG